MPRRGRCSAAASAGPAPATWRRCCATRPWPRRWTGPWPEQRPQTADLVLPVPIAREIAAQVIPMEPALADGGRIVIVLSDRTRERALERMRADFVANASHELRTPLASLIGFIETLRGPAEDDKPARTRFLGIMAEQSERMRRLIDDLLGLSRIELVEHQPPVGSVRLAGGGAGRDRRRWSRCCGPGG